MHQKNIMHRDLSSLQQNFLRLVGIKFRIEQLFMQGQISTRIVLVFTE